MKIVYTSLLVTGMLCYGCSNSPTNKTESNANADSVSTNTSSEKSFEDIGSELLVNERFGNLKIGLSAAKTLEVLGTPEHKQEQEMQEADGEMYQLWEYKTRGISLYMIGKEEQSITSIALTSPCTLKTTKNIGVGSTETEVRVAYHSAINNEDSKAGRILAGTVYGGIAFEIENGKVKSIFVGASAE